MPERVDLQIPSDLAGARADKAVAHLLAKAGHAVSRAEVQRWIDAGLVTTAGAKLARKSPLAAGAVVAVTFGERLLSAAAPDASIELRVAYEDDAILVIDKPAGLVVHPARGHRAGTLVNGLLARDGFAASADPRDPAGHLRPGIVHRLDKDTSGLLVVCKTAAAREALKHQFARHDLERSYLAIALGAARRARYDTPYGRDPRSRTRFTSVFPRDREPNRRAVTAVEPIERLAAGRATLVRCLLATGRTHQIRVHLLEQSGTPVLGDRLYRRAVADADLQRIAADLGRQALHAAVLGFHHPTTGAAMRWESPLPADMQAALEALRRITA